ncbi:formate--tetrahydrofolate ligase [Aerophototrophica crusticola]|uniref:formate--tetrahydrofolate ligase n=1 Tax=Aerophototrophica crusticola TaxID=1709002 RepID=UPI00095316F1
MTPPRVLEDPAGSDAAIARGVPLKPIESVAAELGVPADAVYRHGPFKAKLALDWVLARRPAKPGKLILVTAISPTPAGEGKTTTTIGLGDALRRIGRRVAICLREPSLGPVFGAKGCATGGGKAQVAPMEEINLHFTGDLHAITAANNILAALIDNHIYWGNPLNIDPRRVTWRRCLDLNDRALRNMVIGLGGASQGVPREDGFDITVASEVMAILCLATDLEDLQARLGRVIVAQTRDKKPVTAADLDAVGAMTALLRDAMAPNLVQTLEGTPALVHGGPFANIAHGCNSVIATRAGLSLADYVVTEAGFGADLGAEKFLDIKCRLAGLEPSAAVVVATVRALKMHGGVAKADLKGENVAAVTAGCANLVRHVENMRKFGLPVAVAINRFTADTEAELAAVAEACRALDVEVHLCNHWGEGGAGAESLAHAVAALADGGTAAFKPLYAADLPLTEKIRTIAREIYRADDVEFPATVRARLAEFEARGFREAPVCMAKTQYSFSTDPDAKGAPTGFTLPVREVRLSAGAGFVVVLCGDIMTMPGLPKVPASSHIGVSPAGHIVGLS